MKIINQAGVTAIDAAYAGKAPEGYEFTGEFRAPKDGELFLSAGGNVLEGRRFREPRLILKEAPKKTYKIGQKFLNGSVYMLSVVDENRIALISERGNRWVNPVYCVSPFTNRVTEEELQACMGCGSFTLIDA